jgi:hypothetical protein
MRQLPVPATSEVDKAIIAALNKSDEKPHKELDEEDHFGCIVAATLRRLAPSVRATTKLKMYQLLVEAEFPIGADYFFCSVPQPTMAENNELYSG